MFLTVCCFRTDSCSNGFGIHLNGSGYPFKKNCHPFERLGLSVEKNWGLILENPEGRGVIWQTPSVGVVWVFSAGTTQCLIQYINVRVSNYYEANANLRFFYFNDDF